MEVCRNTKRRPNELERLTKAWSVRQRRDDDDRPKEEEEDPNYTQKFVWMGTQIPKNQIEDAEDMFFNRFEVRVRYLGTIRTLSPRRFAGARAGEYLGEGEGGRHDAVFAVHAEDKLKFATARFKMGKEDNDVPRWWEDYVANNADVIPKEDLKRFLK